MRSPLSILLSVAVLCGLFVSVAHAAEPPALLVTDGGYYFMVYDDDGEPTLVKITKVYTRGGGPPIITPPPPGGPTDPIPNPSAFTNQVRGWAQEVNDPIGARALIEIYRTVTEKVDQGELSVADGFKAIKMMSDQVLAALKITDGRWTNWRVNVGKEADRRTQTGQLNTKEEFVRFGREVVSGLDGATAEAPALNEDMLRTIMEIILMILKTIFNVGLKPTPGPV